MKPVVCLALFRILNQHSRKLDSHIISPAPFFSGMYAWRPFVYYETIIVARLVQLDRSGGYLTTSLESEVPALKQAPGISRKVSSIGKQTPSVHYSNV